MNDKSVTKSDDVDETRQFALKGAHRAVQYLEAGQATGAIIILTGEDRVVMWDSFCTPDVDTIGDAANVLGELGKRFRSVWFDLITDGNGRELLGVIDGDAPGEVDDD